MKLGRTKHEDRDRSVKYQSVGRALLQTARDLDTMGEPKDGNESAIIAIHKATLEPNATRYPVSETTGPDPARNATT